MHPSFAFLPKTLSPKWTLCFILPEIMLSGNLRLVGEFFMGSSELQSRSLRSELSLPSSPSCAGLYHTQQKQINSHIYILPEISLVRLQFHGSHFIFSIKTAQTAVFLQSINQLSLFSHRKFLTNNSVPSESAHLCCYLGCHQSQS